VAVAFDLATGSGGNGTGTSRTFSHTCTGSNLCLYVGVNYSSDPGASRSATYGGVAMTKIAELYTGGGYNAVLYRLVAPASGANDVVVSQTNAVGGSFVAASFTGVHQTTPDGTPVTETDGDESISVTGATADDMVVDFYFEQGGTDLTAGANQTERIDQIGFFNARRTFVSTEAGSDPNTMSWTTLSASTFHVGVRIIVGALTQAVEDSLAFAEALDAAATLVSSLADSFAFSEALDTVVGLGFSHLSDSFEFTEVLQIAVTDLSPISVTWTDRVVPAELNHTESDLVPGETADWVDPTDHSDPGWVEDDDDCSATPRAEATISMTQSDMFCGRALPPPSEQLASSCAVFPAVSVTAGSGPRFEQHALEEVPGTSLVVGFVVPSTDPHDDIAIVEMIPPYTSATKTVIETPASADTFGSMRINPNTKRLVAIWPIGPSGVTERYASIPWGGSSYDVGSATIGTLETGLTTGGQGGGVIPLADGRWLAIYVDKNTTATEFHWTYSQDDGISWSTPSVLAVPSSRHLKAGLAGDVPVVLYSAAVAGSALKLRALDLTTDTWGAEFDPSVTLSDSASGYQFVSIAPLPETRQFGVFYSVAADEIVRLKIFNVTGAGVITLASTETVYDPSPSAIAGVFGTYHSVATAGATWFCVVVTTGGDFYGVKRLASAAAGSSWTSSLIVGSASISGAAQIPIVPRCAAAVVIDYWVSGNTLSFRRFAL
jgi:hypothetical protein